MRPNGKHSYVIHPNISAFCCHAPILLVSFVVHTGQVVQNFRGELRSAGCTHQNFPDPLLDPMTNLWILLGTPWNYHESDFKTHSGSWRVLVYTQIQSFLKGDIQVSMYFLYRHTSYINSALTVFIINSLLRKYAPSHKLLNNLCKSVHFNSFSICNKFQMEINVALIDEWNTKFIHKSSRLKISQSLGYRYISNMS